MVFKKKICIIYLTIAITISIISSVSLSHAQNIVFPEDKPTVSVVGSSEKEISPDQSKISLAVENTATNANSARKANADKMNSIFQVLLNNGLTKENITTSSFEITPNYDYQNNNYNKINSYTALNKIEITISSNVNISKFIDLSVNNGANKVDSIDFIISKKTMDKNIQSLLKEAFANAKEKAEILANEGNFSLNGIKKIDASTEQGFQPPYSFNTLGYSASEKVSAPSTSIVPQKNKVSISIPVTFYIETKPG